MGELISGKRIGRGIISLSIMSLSITAPAQKQDGAATIYNQNHEAVLVTGRTDEKDKSRLVNDSAARMGWALVANPTDKPGKGYMWYDYTYTQEPGRIRGTFRLKVADNTNPAAVAIIHGLVINSDIRDFETRYERVSLKGTDFAKPQAYQTFSIEFIKGEQGFGNWGLETTGVTSVWFDGMTIEQLSTFSTEQLLPLLAQPVRPDGLTLATDGLHVHETYGLYMPLWRVTEAAAAQGADRTQSHLTIHPQATRLEGFPTTWEALYRNQVIVLNNCPAKAVTLVGTLMLKQYVQDGGSLIIMGDTHGLSHGGWTQSALGPLLPVSRTELAYAEKPLRLRSKSDPAAWPYTIYFHRADLHAQAKVLVASNDIPLIVERRTGKGRIIVLLMSVLGTAETGSDGVPFWQWDKWPAVMGKLLKRTAD